jgi:hypothetical protein
MVDFEKEILNEAFDEEEPPTKVIYKETEMSL